MVMNVINQTRNNKKRCSGWDFFSKQLIRLCIIMKPVTVNLTINAFITDIVLTYCRSTFYILILFFYIDFD